MSPANAPWQHDAAEVVAELDTHPSAGLTAAEAARRLQRYGRNKLEAETYGRRAPRRPAHSHHRARAR